MRNIISAIVALAFVSGCAMSAAGLSRGQVKMALESAKGPKEVATCAVEAMIGDNQLRNDGTHYWIIRMNGYGIPVARWDFVPDASGSRAELRTTIGINTGDERVKSCL